MNAYLAPADASAITPTCALQGAIAIAAFASNALLCRVALFNYCIDAATFSDIRLLAGGATLLVVTKLRPSMLRSPVLTLTGSSATGAAGIFVILFSLSYLSRRQFRCARVVRDGTTDDICYLPSSKENASTGVALIGYLPGYCRTVIP
ncbi:hypothetical protein ACU4GD_00490 [Cupriavidus basilensis]